VGKLKRKKRNNIEEHLEKKKPEIDRLIEKYLPKKVSKKWFEFVFGKPRYTYEMKALQEALLKPCWEFLSRGGKRWRPILFLLITQAIGGNLKKIKDFSVIPELSHEGCLPGDTYILKNSGEQVKMNQIKRGDWVYTITSDGKLGRNKVLTKKFTGIKKVYKLITRNREIEATENHPFLVTTKKQPARYKITSAGRKKINTKLKRGDIKKLADYIPEQTGYEMPEIRLKWKPLKKLKEGDKIIVLNKAPDERKSLKLPKLPKDPVRDKTILPNRKSKNLPNLPIDFPIFRIERVKAIRLVGEKPVYDLMVENSHNFIANNMVVHNSIIIDDIEDDGELRRGKPCLHRIFGTDVAINSGNFLYFLPLIALIKNKNKFKPEIISRAYETCVQEMINIHLGQGTDIYWHKGKAKEITEKEYLQMCAFKTGCLSRMAAKLAVVLTEGSAELAEKIGQLAESIGVAFQIQDDILDLTLTGKEREKFGKSFGNDIKEGKRTLMIIHALRKASQRDKKRLLEILDKHTDSLEERKEAIEIIKKYGSIEYAKKVALRIIKESWPEAEKLLPKSKAKEKLEEFVNYLIERKV